MLFSEVLETSKESKTTSSYKFSSFTSLLGTRPAQTMGWWLVSRVSIFHPCLTANGNFTAAATAGDAHIHAGKFRLKPNLLVSFPQQFL